jgi:hypothetical protein
MNNTTENNSLWKLYKEKVWLENSSQTAIVHNILRVLRSIRTEFNYVSTPITSGKVMYENDYDIEKIIDINTIDGLKFANELKDIDNILLPVELIPTDHYKWEQEHFQALWLSIIAEKCKNVYMNDGWEYSNGCSEELVHTFQLRLGPPKHESLLFFNTKESEYESVERMKSIRIFDRKRNEIFPQEALEKLNVSTSVLNKRGVNCSKLERAKNYLEEIINEL